MYGILPGFANGVQSSAVITSAPAAVNDSITSIYCDYNFPLSVFTFTFPSPYVGTVNVSGPNAPYTAPTSIVAPGGVNLGDLLLFIVSTPGPGTGGQGTATAQTAAAVGEVTGLGTGGTSVTFGSPDALNINQSGANGLTTVASSASVAGTTTTVCRLYAVTYFLQVPTAGGTVQVPRLMRQVNGLTAVPVADNIINLQFSYDVISPTTGLMNANISNPIAAGDSPALIKKVNIWVMGQGLTSGNNKSQSMYLATSVSTRNLGFCNSYSNSATVCL
jgi:hypothetical protein